MDQIDNNAAGVSNIKNAVTDIRNNDKEINFKNITEKEMEVLKYMSKGLSSKQIADKLNKSIHTINNQRKNMLHKTNTDNLFQLLAYAIKNDFI